MKTLNFYRLICVTFSLLILCHISAQRGMVTGTMTDSDGEPLPGMNISIVGTQQGTITDLNGYYQIYCSVGDVLQFSFVGFRTKKLVVTAEMFDKNATKLAMSNAYLMEEPDFVKEQAVKEIESKAYTDSLKQTSKNTNDAFETFNMPYKLQQGNCNCRSCTRFYGQNYSDIKIIGNTIKFVPLKEAFRYEIELASYATIKNILNPIDLQTEYVQGRPNNGGNSWFGADNNEIFAWGPKISNLSYDGSDYPYDNSGRLVPRNNLTGAKPYNPYDIFNTGQVFKNSVKLRVRKGENHFNLFYTNRNEKGTLSPIGVVSNLLGFNSRIRKNKHEIETDFNYYTEKDEFANINGLWTKTMMAILTTPPTFDNNQGYMLPDNLQRSSAPAHNNNPYFLLNQLQAKQSNNSFNGKLKYELNTYHLDIAFTTIYNNDLFTETYYSPSNMVSVNRDIAQNRKVDKSNFSLGLVVGENQLYDIDLSSSAILNFETLDYQMFVDNVADQDVRKHRNSLNWSQKAFFEPYIDDFELKIDIKNNIYLADGKQKWLLPYIGVSCDFADLLNWDIFHVIKLKGNYNYAVSEFPLYLKDKSYNTLNQDFANFNTFIETQNLFYDKSLDLEERQSFYTGLNLAGRFFFLDVDYSRSVASNSIFSIYSGNSFELQNLAKIETNTFDVRLDLFVHYHYNLKWRGNILFSKMTSKTLDLAIGNTQIPIAGFQSVSKNLVIGEPVGVIVGSSYLRNETGQLVIGDDGFPLVDGNSKIIGDPTPDFYLSFENEFSYKGFHLNVLVDYQKGGDIWNGTKNNLSYLGLSENTAQGRLVSNYIFDGVTENGQVNTTPVDFANPETGLEGNKWYKYGLGGVAEDAIEDGSWFRIKEVSLSYDLRINRNKFLRELAFKVYAHNVRIFTNYSGASPLSWFNNYTQGQGLDYFNNHSVRELGFGVTLKI